MTCRHILWGIHWCVECIFILVGLFQLLHTFPCAYISAKRRDCKRTQVAEWTLNEYSKYENRTQTHRHPVCCGLWWPRAQCENFFPIFFFPIFVMYLFTWSREKKIWKKKLHLPTCTTSTRNWIGNASLLHARLLAHSHTTRTHRSLFFSLRLCYAIYL